jgi:carbonic anhydrase
MTGRQGDDPESNQLPGQRGTLAPDDALELLLDGNRRYADERVAPRDYSVAGIAHVREHAPIAAILACADARVGAELIFGRRQGDLFMVRVAGNVLGDYGLASLEFAVAFLKAPLVMVLGHTHCGVVAGAIRAVEHQDALPGGVSALIDAIEPSVFHARMTNPVDLPRAASEENVRRQVHDLQTVSPVISAAIAAGRTRVAGAIYDLVTGQVEIVDRLGHEWRG